MSRLSIHLILVYIVVLTTSSASSGTNSAYNKFYSSSETKYLHLATLSSQETQNLNHLLDFILDSPEFRPLTLSIILPEFQSSAADVLLWYSAQNPILVYKIRARDLSLEATWMERSHLTWAFFVKDVFSLNVFVYWQPKLWQSSNQYLIFFNGRTTTVAWRDIFGNLWKKYSVYRAVIVSTEDNFNCLLRYAPFEVRDSEFGGVHKLCLMENATVQKFLDGGPRHLAELKNVEVEFQQSSPDTYDDDTSRYPTESNNVDKVLLSNGKLTNQKSLDYYDGSRHLAGLKNVKVEFQQSSPEAYDDDTSRYPTESNNLDKVLLSNGNLTNQKSLDYHDGSRHLAELKNVEVEFQQSSPEAYDDDTSRYLTESNNLDKVLALNETTRLFEIFHDMNNYPLEVVVFESLLMGIAYNGKTRLRLSKVDAEVLYSLEGATRSKFHTKVMRTVEFRRIADPFDLSLRDIESGRAEMVITGFFVKSYPLHPDFRFTAAVYEDKLCFLAPDSGLVPKAYMPFLPFEKDLWALLAIYNVGITLLWCFMNYLNLAFRRRSVQPGTTRFESDGVDKGDMSGPLKQLEAKTTREAFYPSGVLSSSDEEAMLRPLKLRPLKQLENEASYSGRASSSSDKGAMPRPLKQLEAKTTSEAFYPSGALSSSDKEAMLRPLKQLEGEASYSCRASSSSDKGAMLRPLKQLESEASYSCRASSSSDKGAMLRPLKQLEGEASYSCRASLSSDKGAMPRPLKQLEAKTTSEAFYPSRALSSSDHGAMLRPLKQLGSEASYSCRASSSSNKVATPRPSKHSKVTSTLVASSPSRLLNPLRECSKRLKAPSSPLSNPPTEPPQVPRYVSLFFDFVELFCYPLQTGDTPAQRALLIGTLFFGLIVNGVYQSCLVSSLSKPFHYPQLNTLEDVVGSGKTLFTKYANLKNVFQDDMPLDRTLLQRIRVVNETKSTKYMVAYENTIAITRYFSMVLGNYAYHDREGNPLLHVVDECPMNYRVSYVLRSRSPYMERVNFVLLRLKEAGLFSVWFENITYPLTIVKMRSLRRDDAAVKLTLEHYSLTFLLLFVGLLVSTFTFLGEVYVTRRKRRGGG